MHLEIQSAMCKYRNKTPIKHFCLFTLRRKLRHLLCFWNCCPQQWHIVVALFYRSSIDCDFWNHQTDWIKRRSSSCSCFLLVYNRINSKTSKVNCTNRISTSVWPEGWLHYALTCGQWLHSEYVIHKKRYYSQYLMLGLFPQSTVVDSLITYTRICCHLTARVLHGRCNWPSHMGSVGKDHRSLHSCVGMGTTHLQ